MMKRNKVPEQKFQEKIEVLSASSTDRSPVLFIVIGKMKNISKQSTD